MKILVCGDAMLDRYWHGEVSRISPEAPVPVVAVHRTEERRGGAANVAANIEAMGVPCSRIFSPSEEMVVKLRIIGRNQQVVRIDFDHPQESIDENDSYLKAIREASVVVFSDYGKGALKNVKTLIKIAKSLGKRVFIDPKGHDYERYRHADMIKPNINEMKELVGGWSTEEELSKKARRLMQEGGIGSILLTRADKGMTLYDGPTTTQIPAVAKEIYDVSGAGDTAIAAYAVANLKGFDAIECARFANRAAGIVVARFGTSVASEEEVFGGPPWY